MPKVLSLAIFFVIIVGLFAGSVCAQESENPAAGTIRGALRNDSGGPVSSARVFYSSSATDTRGMVRSGKDGNYVTETLPPGAYLVRVEGLNMIPVERTVTVAAGTAVQADFNLEAINPGPEHVQSKFTGDAPDELPINGRNFLGAGELDPGVQVVDGRALDPGKSGFQTLSIDSTWGRTTRYETDEVEAMDETKGAATLNLPAESVREVTVSRGTPELFQSLNALGAVSVTTKSGGDAWHGNVFGNLREQFLGLAGFPAGPSDYSRQHYGFVGGGALIKNKAFLFVGGERVKQDGALPIELGFPALDQPGAQSALFREDTLTARLDYIFSDNTKGFARLNYDDANEIGPSDSLSNFRDQFHVPGVVAGLDWNRGRYINSARFGYQKMVNSVGQALGASDILASAPFHMQIGSYALGASLAGPRQTVQRDLFGRYDGKTIYKAKNTVRFGGAVHRIGQGDYFLPGNDEASVTSSNGIDTIDAINSDPNLFPIITGDPRGAADNPLNYPVGTLTIFNGLGNFSEKSAFDRSGGGHFDTRLEGYVGDTFNVMPNLNVSLGVNYVRDTGRTDSDIAPIPCSAINTTIVLNPPCTSGLILNQFGLEPNQQNVNAYQSLGARINQPNYNFAPQAGVAWDPGHNGKTVIRASGGVFYDNFLLQNTYQDRVNRLSNGQYNRSLGVCPAGSVLFPNGSLVSSVDSLDIATQICGQPIGATVTGTQGPVVVSNAIQDLQSEFLAAQSAVAGGQNIYSLANSLADFGGMIAPGFKTPRVLHMSGGFEHTIGPRAHIAADFVRQVGTQFPLGIDTNHVGDASLLTDGSNENRNLNTFAAELSAINATLAANPASASCPTAQSAGSSSQASVTCYLAAIPTANINDFAHHGLDSSSAFCGPFPCSVVGKQQAAFGGANPAVGANIMYFPSGRSIYDGIHFDFKGVSGENLSRRVQRLEVEISYTLSHYRTNIAAQDGSGGDYSIMNVAQDFNRPHKGYWGDAGLDRTQQLAFVSTADLQHGVRLSMIAHLGSPLPLTARVPQQDGGGVAGEIFRSDVTGDGTVGDILPQTFIGGTGKYSTAKITQAIQSYNQNYAGKLTPAGEALVGSGLFAGSQLVQLGAYSPLVQGLPANAATATWLKTMDLRLTWPKKVGERTIVEPVVSIFNVFNWANFGGAGNQLSGVLDGAPGTSLNNSSSGGKCGYSTTFCTQRLDRVLLGSGTYANGAPRQMEFGVRVTF